MAATAVRRPAPLVLAALLACGDAGGPSSAAARIDFVDGAIAPILVPGQRVVIEGFGFGATQGDGRVRLPQAGGGDVAAAVTLWTDRWITAEVPGGAVSGSLVVLTAAGRRLAAAVHVVPAVSFDPDALAWQARTDFPASPVGVAVAAMEIVTGGAVQTTLFAAGGAEPIGGDSLMAPDSGVYATRAMPGGAIGAWARQRDHADLVRHRGLPVPRAFAAAAAATPHNSRFPGTALYVIGGVGPGGRAQASVFAADVTADSVVSRFTAIEPLPAPVWGALALVRRGRIYIVGGADSLGRPHTRVFVGRIATDGHIDGWFEQPALPAPRALGGGVVLDRGLVAFGGVGDSIPPGGGLDSTPTRLVTSDTAPLSLVSGFFEGPWTPGPALLPEGRSQFATLILGDAVLVVGGMYAGAEGNAAETIAAPLGRDSVGAFAGPVGRTPIHQQNGGTLVGPAGVTWREADGRHRAIVVGGMDLQTRQRTARCWGF